MAIFKRKKIGLALGGGGARGLAHIGVLKVLEKHNIPIDIISGTSMGAVVGALYSAEPNAKKIEKEAISMDWKKLFDYTISKSGIIKGVKIKKYLEERLNNVKFKDLKIPMHISAYDLKRKREVIFSRGDVAKAVRASISIPGVFFPAENGGKILVDGGVADLIPNEALEKAGAEKIIAVNVENVREKEPLYNQKATNKERTKKVPNALKVLSQAMHIKESEACKFEIANEKVDFVITPDVEEFGALDFDHVKKCIKQGEKAAEKSIKELKKAIGTNIIKEFLAELNTEITKNEIVKNPIKDSIEKSKKLFKK